ncbi:MAG: hypothetical protein IJC71_02720 [Clostridia bacterium]|nr:hypothetical protein [Clostridia bacterium]
MKTLSLQQFTPWRSTVLDSAHVLFPKGGASSVFIHFPRGTFFGEIIRPDQYLSMDLTVCGEHAAGVCWQFWETDGDSYDMSIKMGLLPNLKTRIALPFSALFSNDLFMPRTPGKLKTVVFGHPLHLDRLCKFAVCVDKTPVDCTLKIENIAILDEEPDYPLDDKKMVDALGQKKCADWPGKTHSTEELISVLRAEADDRDATPLPDRSSYGGWTRKKLTHGTGFFALHHDGKRYWLCDPDGYAFFSTGFDCVGLGDSCNLTGITSLCEDLPPKDAPGWSVGQWKGKKTENFNFFQHNVYLAFGDNYYSTWADMIRRRLIRWGCNTIACWSDHAFIRRAAMPYTVIGGGYPGTKNTVFRDFPDVFSPEFAENSEKWAHFLDSTRDDPLLLGYFLSNEPTWAFLPEINIAAMAMNSPEPLCTKDYIIGVLQEKYGSISALNTAWGSGFSSFDAMRTPFEAADFGQTALGDLTPCSAEMIRQYIKIPSEAARRADPNHLNLGIRYAWLSTPILASGCEYTDIFSFNCYDMDPYPMIDEFSRLTKKPVMIGEFHFGALDRGMDATGLRGVQNQHERGAAYRRYMHRAASHPMCLGAHYFILYDQAYLGRFDGENYQIGALDICSRPYTEFIDGIILTHSELYGVADGTVPVTEEKAKEIEAIAF